MVLAISGRTGLGIVAWLDLLLAGGRAGAQIAEVDYDVYAAGEAELGWLNATLELAGESAFSADEFVQDLVALIAGGVKRRGLEIAHLKVLLQNGDRAAVANCVGLRSGVALSQALGADVFGGTLTVNARVHMAPEPLRDIVDQAIASVALARELRCEMLACTQFRPGRPVPTHRFQEDVITS